MDLQDLKKLDIFADDGDCSLSVTFDHVEQEFTDTDKNLVLYSNVKYHTKDFVWEAVLPTVRIPYKDPALGFLVGGVVFSSVGIYQRAPGLIQYQDTDGHERVDIVTSRNTTISLVYRRNGIHIMFSKRDKKRYVPIGVFLKAFSGMPYSEIQARMAYKPLALLNSFPCEVPKRAVDLAKVDTYGVDRQDEPSVEECIDAVYSAILQLDSKGQQLSYSSHWKSNRIQAYFNGLKFKSEQNYERSLAAHARAVGTVLDRDIYINIYNEEGREERFGFSAGTYIDEVVAEQLRWYDFSCFRVRTERSFLIQEDAPMLFRAVGYKLANDIPELGARANQIIDTELLKRINSSQLWMLDVITPDGRKTLMRSGADPEFGDFVTILNTLFTSGFIGRNEDSQYEVANRVVVDYSKQVAIEVEQVYQEIAASLMGCQQLRHVLESMPKLPSTYLETHLRDSSSKELAQSEVTNVMSRAISEKRASALMRATPAEMTAIQRDQYARIDSLHSPESDKVGSVQQMTAMSRLNPDTAEIEAPYEKVVNGIPTGKIEYISASKERGKYIVGWNDDLSKPVVMARYNGDVTTVVRERVNYRDVSPFCDMSVSRMTIPFPEFSQPRRSLMATKMSGQAVPLLFPERPLVSTGADTEIPCLYYTARSIVNASLGEGVAESAESEKLEILGVRWTKLSGVYSCTFAGRAFSYAVPFMATDKETLYNYNLNFKEDNVYNLDDIVFYNQSCDLNSYDLYAKVEQGSLPLIKDIGAPSLALGVNLTVLFKTYRSSTVDDAVVISDRLVKNKKLSSIQIFKYSYELKSGEKFRFSGAVPALHKHVYSGEPVITILRKKTNGTSEKHVFAKQEGEVVFAETRVEDRVEVAEVWVATLHDAAVGDKVAGRHGNKSVIAKIIPEEDMPYDPETGESADIICSPLGVPSRMNYGIVLESTLAMAMGVQGKHAVVTPFYPAIRQDVRSQYSQAGLSLKKLYNPVYGKYTERPVMVGKMYFLKLEQMSNLKWAAVGYPTAIDPVFGQPVTSTNTNKGQSMEEMITWALAASGSKQILNNFFTLYSSDEASRKRYFDMLAGNNDAGGGVWDESTADAVQYRPDNKDALVSQTIFRMFGLDLVVKDEHSYQFLPLDMDDISIDLCIDAFKSRQEVVEENEWCKIALRSRTINPFWIESFPLNLVLGVKSVKALVNKTYYLNVYERTLIPAKEVTEMGRAALITGVEAVIALLENTTIEQAINRFVSNSQIVSTVNDSIVFDRAESKTDDAEDVDDDEDHKPTGVVKEDEDDEDSDNPGEILQGVILNDDDSDSDILSDMEVSAEVSNIVRFLRRMQNAGLELVDLIWDYMPVMPKVFRQTTILNGVESEHSFTKQLRRICECGTPSDAYDALRQFIGYGRPKNEDLMSLRGYFFGKGSQSGQHGTVRGNVLSKRIGFSGRAVIIPSTDVSMSPYFFGVPWSMAMIELSKVLTIRLRNKIPEMARELRSDTGLNLEAALLRLTDSKWERLIQSLGEFNNYMFESCFPLLDYDDRVFLFNYFRSKVRAICEGNVSPDGLVFVNGKWVPPEEVPDTETIDAMVVVNGRQPTLHKKSLRCFFGKLVDGYSQVIHPLVCAGFNADFDGDTMWHAQLLGEMKNEGWRTISVLQDLISEKDGSYTLGLVQDTALGLYCATIFKDNAKEFKGTAGEYYYFESSEALRHQLEYGDLHYYDVVVFKSDQGDFYISTAGRILVNSVVPGALTKAPLDDRWGICSQILGQEAVSSFCQLKYDTIWLATSIRPDGREEGVKSEKVLLEVYDTYGARTSVNVVQTLYEIGLVASDIYSVTICMDDMSVDVDIQEFMNEPRAWVAKLNTLEQMGLISERERKDASIKAWERARKQAMSAVVKAIPATSNTHFMMYSGARGKPDQVMQTVGFIGTVSKTVTSDIEYPILRGYGSGLTSLDLAQTCPTARIGVVSTQTGTKATGYATRQTVYMSSGMGVVEDDCGIEWRSAEVRYNSEKAMAVFDDGTVTPLIDLVGEVVDPTSESVSPVVAELNQSGYILTEEIVQLLLDRSVEQLDLFDKKVRIKTCMDPSWKSYVLEHGYSYALPYTEGRKITAESLEWVEKHGLTSIIVFDEGEDADDLCFDREAYLPVEYDTSKYTLTYNGSVVSEEVLFGRVVDPNSESYFVYKKLLDNSGALTVRALQYLTKKKCRSILFADGSSCSIVYKISDLFSSLVLSRDSIGLPFLDKDGCITQATLDEVEKVQLDYIPVRTMLTCLSDTGVCSHCCGKSQSTKKYHAVGENLGIAAAQAECEPLSQATLNVTHSGGKRGAGVGLVSGLEYYRKMLRGKLVTEKTKDQQESFASVSGYVQCNKHNSRAVRIVDESGTTLDSVYLSEADRLNVPDGAYVFQGDTLQWGLPVLTRYCDLDIFTAALKTRYLLMQQQYKIFKALNVSPRNYEVLVREQTSICFLKEDSGLPPTKDTGVESRDPTGKYSLRVATQPEVVNKYSGIAGFAFEDVASMISAGVMQSSGLSLNSILGNLVTGTPVGSSEAKFIPKRFGKSSNRHKKSAVRSLSDTIKAYKTPASDGATALKQGASQSVGGVVNAANSLLDSLFAINKELQGQESGALPEPASKQVESLDIQVLADNTDPVIVTDASTTAVIEEVVDVENPVQKSSRLKKLTLE